MLKRLTKIGLKHETDKAYFHLFTEFYNDYFETYTGRPINILEIGIDKGASLLTLKDFFPEASIYAIDINPDSVNLNLGNSIHKYLCSQDDFANLQKIFYGLKFDIIVEDGSHMTSHQQSSLGFFFPYLNRGGMYISEDLHTCYRKGYIDTPVTAMDMIKYYQANKIIKNEMLSEDQINYLNENITDVILYERKENALKCYNCKNYNIKKLDLCNQCQTILSPEDESIACIFIHK